MFVWGFSSHPRTFHTFNGERLQILTYTWHAWPLSSKGSLTGANPKYWSSSRTYYTHTGCQALRSGAVPIYFKNLDLDLSRPQIEFRSPACEAHALPGRSCGGYLLSNWTVYIHVHVLQVQ